MQSDKTDFIAEQTRGAVRLIWLRRGPANALHAPMIAELGRALSRALKQRGMGIIVDIVPNHMGIGVLGPDSDSAHRDHFHFDMGPWAFCQLDPVDPRSLRK